MQITKIGNIEEFQKQIDNFSDSKVVTLGENEFLMPGFVDCHTHAPQYPNIGLGLDLPLLDWLNKYTFPLERHYSDAEFAANVYDIVVVSKLCYYTIYSYSLHYSCFITVSSIKIYRYNDKF